MTAKEKVETTIQRAVKLEAVPQERFSVMLQRTVLGLLLVGVGIAGLAVWGMNHYLAVGLVLLGATTWSTQLVTGALKALVGPLKALKGVKDGD